MIIETWDIYPDIAIELNRERDNILDSIAHSGGAWKFSEELQKKMDLIRERSVLRYFELSGGNYDFIMKDAAKIIKALERQDCLNDRKTRTVFLNDLIEFYQKTNVNGSSDKIIKATRKMLAETKKNYDFAYTFICGCVETQAAALEHYGLDTTELYSAAAAKASQWYKKPATEKKRVPSENPNSENYFFSLPTSPAAHLAYGILENGRMFTDNEGIIRYKERRKTINPNSNMEIKRSTKGSLAFIQETNQSETKIIIDDLTEITKYNKAAKKLFAFALIKVNEQVLNNGVLTRRFIEFPLQELIDLGFYTDKSNARRGFLSASLTLSGIKLKGTLTKKKGSKAVRVEQAGWATMFTSGGVSGGTCKLGINPDLNWNLLTSFFTILPRYSFSLPVKSFDLIYNIFYFARQNTKSIKEKGYFTVSFRSIQEALCLPDEKQTKNPERDIRQPIEGAITAIEEKNQDADFTITPIYNNASSITDFLNNGYLKIGLSGKYAEPFINQYNKKSNRINAAKKRKDSIIDKAIALNMSKNMVPKDP